MLDYSGRSRCRNTHVIVDAKAGLMNRGIQIAIFVLVFVIPMTSGKGFVSVVKPMNEKLHVWLTAGNYSATSAVTRRTATRRPTTSTTRTSRTRTTGAAARAPFYADISSKSASGEFVFFNTLSHEGVVTELGVETRSRYFHPGVEDLTVNLYYMYSFVPSGFVAGLLGYHSLRVARCGKRRRRSVQPIIASSRRRSRRRAKLQPEGREASDAIYTQPQGTNSKFTLGDILTHANVSLERSGRRRSTARDARHCSARPASTCRCRCTSTRRYGWSRRARSDLRRRLCLVLPWVDVEGLGDHRADGHAHGARVPVRRGLHFKLDGEFFIFDPWALAFFFAINSVYLGMASFVVLMIIGVFFEQRNLYREAYQDRVRPTAGAAHLLQAVTARRLFDAIDATNEGKQKNGKVSRTSCSSTARRTSSAAARCAPTPSSSASSTTSSRPTR